MPPSIEKVKMWIECTNPATDWIQNEHTDGRVTFSDNGTAQVSEDVGEALVASVWSIEPYDQTTDSDNKDDE